MNDSARILWNKILDGETDLDDPEVIAMEKLSVEFGQRVAQWRVMQSDLDLAGDEMGEILQEANQDAIRDKDIQLLHASRRAHSGESRPRPKRKLSPSLAPWAGLAAALLIAVGGWAWYQGDSKPQESGPMLGGPETIVPGSPIGLVGEWGEFQWQGEMELGGWAIVRVVDLDTGAVRQSPKLSSHRWTPKEALPYHRVRWSVSYYKPSGDPAGTSSVVEAWR